MERLLDVRSLDDEDEDDDAEPEAAPEQDAASDADSSDEYFDNFDAIKRGTADQNAAEVCANLERAAQILVQLDLEFLDGVDIPTIQVRNCFIVFVSPRCVTTVSMLLSFCSYIARGKTD